MNKKLTETQIKMKHNKTVLLTKNKEIVLQEDLSCDPWAMLLIENLEFSRSKLKAKN